MSRAYPSLSPEENERIFNEQILPNSRLLEKTSHEHPKAIILGGQPGAGKGGLAKAASTELDRDVVLIDPDAQREYHSQLKRFQREHPYTWSSDTHADAGKWADKLLDKAVALKKNIIFDITLSNGQWTADLIKDLQSKGYEVEVRAIATHKLESELGVDERFTRDIDKKGFARYVPEGAREAIYDKPSASLDIIHTQTTAPIQLYNREGSQLYDSRTDARAPGALLEEAREARMRDPEITRRVAKGWQEQQRWHNELPEAIRHNPRVDAETAHNLMISRHELRVIQGVERYASESITIDRAVRIEPAHARGAVGLKVTSAAVAAYDTIATGRETAHLLDQGNITGAQSHVLRFGSRNLGMAAGAIAGAQVGAALGVESGPGLFATGAVGGIVGAIAGDKIMDAADQARIDQQRGSDGNAWRLDGRAGHGWMRMSTDDGPGRGGMPMRPVYADAHLADELNYKASSVAVELALARGPALRDPFRQPPETTGEAVRPGVVSASQPWIRDPQSHAWTRQTLEPATPMSHGMPVQRTVTANPAQTLQLDRAAQATVADNIAHGPLAAAERYQSAYDQHGWKQHGPMPEAVRAAAQTPPGQLPASDGHTYTQGKNGQWTAPGSLYGTNTAQTSVRDELDATRQQVRAQAQAQPVADRLTPQQIERITTHESRIARTPGGMSFAEAHKRRDEPEQISPGSLQPVGKLDVPASSKGSVLHRMHQASEQNLMRGLGIAQAQDRERFRNEPSPSAHRTPQPSVERTHERAQDQVPRRLLQEAPEQKQPETRQAAPSAPAMHPPTPSRAEPVAHTPPPSLPMAQPAAAAIAAAQAEKAAALAELAEMQQRVARMEEQRRQEGLERRDERDQREATQGAQSRDTRQHLDAGSLGRQPANVASHTSGPSTLDRLSAFSDPNHPHNAMYSKLKELLPEGTSEKRLAQSTSACYLSGIDEKNLRGIDINGTRAVFAGDTFMKSGIAVVDISQPPPTVQQSEQQVQQYDRQQAQMMSEIRAQNAAQANQQQGATLGGR